MKVIDVNTWDRKSHYEWFSKFANPMFGMNVRMDLTKFLPFCKDNGYSSFSMYVYAACAVMNNCRAFRLRELDGKVVEVEKANAAYTLMASDNTFINVHATMQRGLNGFLEDVAKNKARFENSGYVQDEYNNLSVVDEYYCSCVPWLDFLSVTQPVPDFAPESKCIPRLVWGKYTSMGGRTGNTLNVLASHALVDGRDMAEVYNNLQAAFNDMEKFLANNS